MTPSRAGLAWAAPALALFFLVLARLWFNAPVWDDYDAILDCVMRMKDAASGTQWLAIVVAQHNEHRIAVVRLAAGRSGRRRAYRFPHAGPRRRPHARSGQPPAPAMAEFRDRLAAALLFAAAAFLLLQWSYFEATLMASAALANIALVLSPRARSSRRR